MSVRYLRITTEAGEGMPIDGWSLEPADWRQLAEVLRGVQWRRKPLNSLYRDSIPTRPGVYLLLTERERLARNYQIPADLVNAIYAGRSDNLRRRFLQHANPESPNPLIVRCHTIFGYLNFAFTVVPDAHSDDSAMWLRDAESELVRVLSPPANRSIPRGRPLIARLGEPQRV